ncbi:MAG TPA: SDR family oxidoreductase [Anaerolineales bacterium]|nr:SDR family oxidoreductase [Anaerolineales bacterium]HRF47976.1 SDR family oxidoreductase [Anaerolineales bacterium]
MPEAAVPVALVTGARKGIGRYLAEHLLARGYQVEGCSRGPADWEAEGYRHHELDVADEGAVKALFAEIQKRQGRLDVLVNNAGVASMNHVLLTPDATAARLLGTNFHGTFLMCREAAKVMRRRKYGRIVNVSTIAVPMQLEGESLYAASKGAVETFTRVFAREVADFGITCNIVGPTPIETDLIRNVPKDKIDGILQRLAIKRLGRFEDVANVIDFFVRPESDYVTGQVIYLGGVS